MNSTPPRSNRNIVCSAQFIAAHLCRIVTSWAPRWSRARNAFNVAEEADISKRAVCVRPRRVDERRRSNARRRVEARRRRCHTHWCMRQHALRFVSQGASARIPQTTDLRSNGVSLAALVARDASVRLRPVVARWAPRLGLCVLLRRARTSRFMPWTSRTRKRCLAEQAGISDEGRQHLSVSWSSYICFPQKAKMLACTFFANE